MDRDVAIELVKYADIHATYKPQVGDVVMCHGYMQRVKWFGVVNGIDNDSNLKVVKGGMPRLLVQMSQEEMAKNTISIPFSTIKNSVTGTYTIIQHVRQHNSMVWYV